MPVPALPRHETAHRDRSDPKAKYCIEVVGLLPGQMYGLLSRTDEPVQSVAQF